MNTNFSDQNQEAAFVTCAVPGIRQDLHRVLPRVESESSLLTVEPREPVVAVQVELPDPLLADKSPNPEAPPVKADPSCWSLLNYPKAHVQ